MKRMILTTFIAAALGVAATAAVSAQAAGDRQLGDSSVALSSEGSSAGGSAAVIQAIEKTFGVTAAQVSSLQSSGLGYGEIVIALTLAQSMNGGLTASNIDAVVAMHQGPPEVGWGQVARTLGVNLGTLVSKVRTETAEAKEIESSSGKEKDDDHSAVGRENESEHPEGAGSGAGTTASGGRR